MKIYWYVFIIRIHKLFVSYANSEMALVVEFIVMGDKNKFGENEKKRKKPGWPIIGI